MIEWNEGFFFFFKKIMIKLGFHPRWVHLAMETISTASYAILINGEPPGFITPTCGIKQGDLLSPYLFILCAKGLFAMLRNVESTYQLKGIMLSQNEVCISHLLFANDSLLFCQATVEECQRLLNILGQYETVSGKTINRQKTYPFFSKNIKLEVRGTIQQLLGARIMTEYERYLGLPTASGKSKVNTFKDLHQESVRVEREIHLKSRA